MRKHLDPETVTAFAKARADKVGEAIRDALTDESGNVGAPFVVLIPIMGGCITLSNMDASEALNVQLTNVTQAALTGLLDAAKSGKVTVIPLTDLDDDHDREPNGKAH